jgi:hypothetical protein
VFTSVPLAQFEERTGIKSRDYPGILQGIEQIVSLRDIAKPQQVSVMPRDYLESLVRNITLARSATEKPYEHLEICLERTDPHGLLIGQTFVLREKYRSILEDFADLFDGFCVTRGAAKCNAMVVAGYSIDGVLSLAHYLPPIVEEHYGHRVLLDGIHRNYLVMKIGTTLETVVVKGVRTTFPAKPQRWSQIKVVNEKPVLEDRYFDLQHSLFRQLHEVGIDG